MTSVKDTHNIKSHEMLKQKLEELKTQTKDLEKLIDMTAKYEQKYGNDISRMSSDDNGSDENFEACPVTQSMVMRRRLLIC